MRLETTGRRQSNAWLNSEDHVQKRSSQRQVPLQIHGRTSDHDPQCHEESQKPMGRPTGHCMELSNGLE